jgi:thioredoxin reductase (NADPH)
MNKLKTKINIYCGLISLGVTGFIFSIKYPNFNLEQLKTISNIVPVLVIGSGPAGLSAALYTSRADFNTIVISGDQLGGTLMDVKYIENWPGRKKTTGAQAIEELQDQAESFGTKIIVDAIKTVDFSSWPYKVFTENDLTLNALSVIIATGGTPKKLDIPGVEKYWGNGVGLCSICEAPFNKGKDVAVIGGGDTAAERALQLAAYANKVYMIVKKPTMDANATVQGYLHDNKNIEIKTDTELKEILGDGINVAGMTIFDHKTNSAQQIPISAVYFAIGYSPNSQHFKDYISIDKDGFIKTNGYNQIATKQGIFAAGNVACSDKDYGKAGVALGSGVKAGMDAIKFLESIGLTPEAEKELEKQFYYNQL